MNIDNYLKEGFVLSPYYSKEDIEKHEKATTKVLYKEDIRTIIVGTIEERTNILYSANELILVKYANKYHINPQDLIEKFEKELNKSEPIEYDDIISWTYFGIFNDSDGPIFLPHLDEEYYKTDRDGIEDYLFEKDDHIVSFIIRLIKTELRKNKVKEDLLNYVNFIKDVLSKKDCPVSEKSFSTATYSLILKSLSYEDFFGRKLPKNIENFFHTHLLENADRGDISSMRTLGYEYYDGTNGFPCDFEKSLYWLEKYFKATEDPDVARTIGYIYYYGRTTNGVPQGDKAFQYFAIGHIAGHYYEATYKLADCYLKGYGTPVSKQAAYNLVRGIYEETLGYFLSGTDSKFADVALRLGNYYKNGTYVEKDLEEAQLYLLEAKVAIKNRLENMEYIGDRSVAVGISNTLEEVEKELKIEDRVIKDNGYLVKNPKIVFRKDKFEISFINETIYLGIERKEEDSEKYFINTASSIGFAERSEKVIFKITPYNPESAEGFVKAANESEIKEIALFEDKIYAVLDLGDEDSFPAFTTFTELIIYPQTIKDISKKYLIASVEFYPGSKLYDYLCLDSNIKVGDTKTITSRGERKQVTVRTIKNLYEDQLPLPYEKMAKIN